VSDLETIEAELTMYGEQGDLDLSDRPRFGGPQQSRRPGGRANLAEDGDRGPSAGAVRLAGLRDRCGDA